MDGDGDYISSEISPDLPTDEVDRSEARKNQNKIETLKDIKSNTSRYIEKRAIRHVLNMTGWNKSETAKILKISYKTLFTKMNELGIE